jgi:DNA polymerase/3'-5' exonuclease PolX
LAYFREALHVFRLHSTSLFGFGEDADENIFQAKKNIEMVEKQMSGFGGSGGGRGI